MKRLGLFIMTALTLTVSCRQEELRDGHNKKQENIIQFSAVEYKATLTRSDEGSGTEKLMYLGMAGKDSLFLKATEIVNTTTALPETKGSESYVPTSFHVNAFLTLNGTTASYLDLKLESTDGWQTYSPTLYWPNNYEYIHFFTYSYNLGDNLISPSYSTTNGYKASFDYLIPYSETSEDDAEVQPDITFAIAPEQRESENPVNLGFVHALAAVEFKIGEIGDATVASSFAALSDILCKGTCTVTYPVTAESIEWTTTGERESYTQTLKSGVPFMVIPQEITDNILLDIEVTVGDVRHEFPSIKLNGITEKWEVNKKYTYTIVKGGEVKVDVSDSQTQTLKTDVKIQNTGLTTSYIRAAIVGYWFVVEDGIEKIAGTWDINDSDACTLVKAADWDSHWVKIGDIYYHKNPVEPGEKTAPLFDSYQIDKTTGPVAGSKLNISIAAQAIKASEAHQLWPELPQTETTEITD